MKAYQKLPGSFHGSFVCFRKASTKASWKYLMSGSNPWQEASSEDCRNSFRHFSGSFGGTFQELFRKLSESYWKLHVVCRNLPVVFPERMREAYKNTSSKTSASIYVRLLMDLLELSIKLPWQLPGSAQCLDQIHDEKLHWKIARTV